MSLTFHEVQFEFSQTYETGSVFYMYIEGDPAYSNFNGCVFL